MVGTEDMGQELVFKAYGKINLGLDVVRRLENGYHEVRMIMQSVKLADIVTIKRISEDKIVVRTDQENLPCDVNRLANKVRFGCGVSFWHHFRNFSYHGWCHPVSIFLHFFAQKLSFLTDP